LKELHKDIRVDENDAKSFIDDFNKQNRKYDFIWENCHIFTEELLKKIVSSASGLPSTARDVTVKAAVGAVIGSIASF
jgi:hypothetical protein